MITEITKRTFGMDGKPCFSIEHAVVTCVEPMKSGVSQKTGEAWKLIVMNIKLNLGEDVRPDYMRLCVSTRLADKVQAMGLTIGSQISALVSFSVSGSRILTNDIRVLDLIKEG